jgi:hypothetical protein
MIQGKFPLGRLVMTTHLQDVLKESDPGGWQEELNRLVSRHARGQWGAQLSPEDAEANNRALAQGGRLLSAYITSKGIKVWIITEHDRSATTCLLPEDY